jgi:ArsR family transcriptional regulator
VTPRNADLNAGPDGPIVPSGPSVPLSEAKAELFKALGHPARIRCLEVLATGERSVGELQPMVGIELSHLSQQLGVLRRAGLVSSHKIGSSAFYAIKDPELIELMAVARRLLLGSLHETHALISGLQEPATGPCRAVRPVRSPRRCPH